MKHRYKSLAGAVRRIRQLERIMDRHNKLIERFNKDRILMARLAVRHPFDGSPYFQDLDQFAATVKLRDEILARYNSVPLEP